ncbi:hypothetical protein H072_9323 [Dactylellina haptotyla CBS 200.50]|uniref:ML-like domain-containing protein n=1 Tax=Dactylellina haptotyla (strain CBS 200.50) TaxID=1284197 RepID=S8BCX6_DACHA|nr:hypothetical protein H072_9323 [Dactylellina haptotyla CBS 200.50]
MSTYFQPSWRPLPLARLCWILTFVSFIAGSAGAIPKEKMLGSQSLSTCMDNSQFTLNQFFVMYTPNNSTLQYSFDGESSIQGNVTITLDIIVYGYPADSRKIDPCDAKAANLCPMSPGPVGLKLNSMKIDASYAKQIPSVAFTVPDIDGVARITISSAVDKRPLACLEAEISNGQTVHQNGVSWTTAIIASSGLVASAVVSCLGHSKTGSHVAAIAISIFGYFQSQALCAMVAVKLPPAVRAWTQNFVWSMGIIRIGFMQDVLHWYVQSTGGKADTLLDRLNTVNVQIAKRGLELSSRAVTKGGREFITVTGISRVAFLAKIERTNLFMTSLGFFVAFVAIVTALVAIFRFTVARGDKFAAFKKGWDIVLKGILYRVFIIGFPLLSALCLWELTVRDSPAVIVLAIFFFLIAVGLLSWASYQVIGLARSSIDLQKNSAVYPFDPSSLKWGFLYVQFNEGSYYWIVPMLVYTLIKGIFIAFAQSNGRVQVIALLIIEALYLIAVCYIRPWMNRKLNTINISISVISFLNSVFLLIFSGIFKAPGLVRGVVGVVFFILNAIFALILLITIIVTTGYALFSKNPDARYQVTNDDKSSFMHCKSRASVPNLGTPPM